MPEGGSAHCLVIVDKDLLVVVGTGITWEGAHEYSRKNRSETRADSSIDCRQGVSNNVKWKYSMGLLRQTKGLFKLAQALQWV